MAPELEPQHRCVGRRADDHRRQQADLDLKKRRIGELQRNGEGDDCGHETHDGQAGVVERDEAELICMRPRRERISAASEASSRGGGAAS